MTRFMTAVGLVLTGVVLTAQTSPKYVVTGLSISDLGTLGGAESVALDINNFGDVVGWSHTPEGRRHPFLYWFGAMNDISGDLADWEGEATGVNRYTTVVGTMRQPTWPNQTHAVHWSSGTMVQMEDRVSAAVAELCSYDSIADAINDDGVVVGSIGLVATPPYVCGTQGDPAYWVDPATPRVLDPHPGHSGGRFHEVNNINLMVGEDRERGSGILWWAGAFTLLPTPAGLTGVVTSNALGVSNANQVAGYFFPARLGSSARRALFWNGTAASSADLGVLPTGTFSVAHDVNDLGFVAGYGDRVTPSPIPGPSSFVGNAGFIWHKHFGMVQLPRLPTSGPWGSCEAYALTRRNQWGRVQVAGFCTTSGRRHAVRWDVLTELR